MSELLTRFCRYVKVETTAVDDAKDYPSSPGQWTLGKMLAGELRKLGLKNVEVTNKGIVLATIPGNTPAPTIAWLAHLDTSPEASAKNVKPILHEKYNGKDIVLPGDKTKVIRVADSPRLKELIGRTIITSDGTTLLGADDKAGVAVIMTACDYLMKHPEIPHGTIKICFSCDEEVGHGADHIDVKKLAATVAYTLDGESEGEIEAETFSADQAVVTVTGYNIHPGLAYGKMVNAIRILSEFIARMPRKTLTPETTCDRQQFLHPYVLEGGVAEAKVKILLRSFDTRDLAKQADLLRKIAASLKTEFPKAQIDVTVTEQYRNMRDDMKKEPRAVALAERAHRNIGIKPAMKSIRGGTDGSRLTAMGLPTPNLSTGMHNFHSYLEYACLEEMETAVKVLIELARQWSHEEPDRKSQNKTKRTKASTGKKKSKGKK